jgi:protein-S-isoprenylcysteine O-methyltransferase Ste14
MSATGWVSNRRGEWYVIGQAVLIAAVLAAPTMETGGYTWSGLASAASAALCLVGLGGVVLGSITLGGRNVSPFPRPTEDGALVERGIFSVVRHPIYAGFSLAAFGWSLMWSSVVAFAAALVLLAFFDIKARREERWLEGKYPGYRAYRSRVKKLIPFLY